MNEHAALDFIVYSLFGDMSCPENAVISRAYVDMASHTLKSEKFANDDEKWDCRYRASQKIRKSLNDLSEEEDFDVWHKDLCEDLINIYSGRLSYGQAQKWVNMTIKYVYVLKCLGVIEKSIFPFISDEHKELFHPPIDSYILKHVLNDSTTWSTMNDTQYNDIRQGLNDVGFDFLAELHEWSEIAEAERDYDNKSYAYFLKNKPYGSSN